MRTFIAFILLLFMAGVAAAQTDPFVDKMVQAVSKQRVTDYVQTLQDFQTRHTYTQGNTDAGVWLYDFFTNLGIEVEYHQFTFGSHTEYNIIARIQGKMAPDEIVAISGHFDSTSNNPYVLAPGADDDASGIAAVLETALIFKDYQFERTVEFMCFNGEEQGRQGSKAIASDYKAAGKDLVAVLNNDMIGYWPTAWQRDLDVAYEPISRWLAEHVISACDRYVGIPAEKQMSGVCRDDHVSFTDIGYSAITNMDCWQAHNGGPETTPHYHKTTDTIDTLNLDCMTEAVQVNVAALAELAGPLSLSTNDDTISAGTGGSAGLALTAGPAEANRLYMIFGTISGTSPGTTLPGGLVLPINWDFFSDFVIILVNSPFLQAFMGTLDGSGAASAILDTQGPVPGAAGITMNYAFAMNNPWNFVSNPIQVEFVP
jgi:leucyl aminopeptidase